MNLKLLALFSLFAVGTVTSLATIRTYQNQDVLGTYSRNNRRRPTSTIVMPTATITPIAPVVSATATATIVLSTTLKPTITPTKVPTKTPTSTPTKTPTKIPTKAPTLAPSKVPTAMPVSSSGLKWGAYTSWKAADVIDFETRVGKQMNYIATFVHWGNENELPLELGNLAKSRGQTLLMYWEAMDYNVITPEDPRFSYDAILSGKWDSYLTSFASQAKSFGGQIVLIPFEEMNGDWYTWSVGKNGNSIAKHISAYRYVRKFFTGITNVKFGWTINNQSETGLSANFADYYPGDEYVDIIGTNGFNFGSPWQTFSQVFDSGLAQLEKFNKPIMLFSTSSAPGTQKAGWITDAFGTQIKKHPKVIGWIWFNENKEKDWRVWSDANALSAYKSILP